MKRREWIKYAGAGTLAMLGTVLADGLRQGGASVAATPNSLTIKWLGHTCFLVTGGGQRVLINPFRAIGCTAGYRQPKVASDYLMISSQLLDEGFLDAVVGSPKLLAKSGVYQFPGLQVQGIATDHDRRGGRQFGSNVTWRWTQANISLLHLGGIASPITLEQRILMGSPDVLFIPVGGGPKAYNAEEATAAVKVLTPKLVIPTHYLTQAANNQTCDISPVDEFITLMQEQGMPTRKVSSDQLTMKSTDLPAKTEIRVLTYKF